MCFGKTQRKLLAKAFAAGDFVVAAESEMSKPQKNAIYRAVHTLRKLGLIMVITEPLKMQYPAAQRLQFRLTSEGELFCGIFHSALVSNARIRLARFTERTGVILPNTKMGRPAWLIQKRPEPGNLPIDAEIG